MRKIMNGVKTNILDSLSKFWRAMKSRLPLRLPAPSPPIGDLESQRNNILDAKPDLEKELGKTLLTWCFTAALQITTRSKQVAESEIDNSISLLALGTAAIFGCLLTSRFIVENMPNASRTLDKVFKSV